eukprot:754981-Prymnesium_polylepis.1
MATVGQPERTASVLMAFQSKNGLNAMVSAIAYSYTHACKLRTEEMRAWADSTVQAWASANTPCWLCACC